MAKLSSSLVLNKYILNLFGVTDLEALSLDLKDSSLEGYDENNISHFHHALVARFYSNANLPKELLLQYDQNIFSHTQTISEKRNEPIKWKYFQYMALLFTEIYLDKYFSDKTALQSELNTFLEFNHGRNGNDFKAVTQFQLESVVNDLNKLAYWNATGSGKTLLMHINILQYRYYLKMHNLEKGLNRIIVLTPNEGLSKQHLKEFAQSGMEAELFDKTGGSLFAGQKIEIIDIHKLEETSGNKTVAVEAFEGNNLVLVDEGHRGAGGTEWKDKRNRLCESGFSFEYSATFGQAVHALSGAKQKVLIDEYGKAKYNLIVWQMILRFADFWNTVKPRLIATEQHIFSDEYKYAGTIDLVVEIDGKICLLDIKTSNSLHTSYDLQLAAYAQAWNENFDTPIEQTGIIWLKSSSRGADKSGKKLQGDGWALKTPHNTYQENLQSFLKVYDIFKLENPDMKPYSEKLPISIKLES